MHHQLASTNNSGTSVSAALQQRSGESCGNAATSGSIVGFVWEPFWVVSAAFPGCLWDGGGSSHHGGLDNWDGGGEWSGGGWHEAVGNDTSASEVSVETEGNRESVVQVVEGHVVEDGSEEVSIDFTVISSAASFFGVSVFWVCVGNGAKSTVVVSWIEWKAQSSQNIFVLDSDIAGGSILFVVNSDAIFAVVPCLAHTVNVVHFWTSSWFVVAKVTPATVLEDVGQCEQVHDVSVISGGSES